MTAHQSSAVISGLPVIRQQSANNCQSSFHEEGMQLSQPRIVRLGFFEDEDVGVRSASYRLGIEEDSEGFEKYLLLPAKHLRRERRANDKHHGQCRDVAHMSRPGVALPNAFEQ